MFYCKWYSNSYFTIAKAKNVSVFYSNITWIQRWKRSVLVQILKGSFNLLLRGHTKISAKLNKPFRLYLDECGSLSSLYPCIFWIYAPYVICLLDFWTSVWRNNLFFVDSNITYNAMINHLNVHCIYSKVTYYNQLTCFTLAFFVCIFL